MPSKSDQALKEKLVRLGHPDFTVAAGEDEIAMLYLDEQLICGALYGLSLSDEALSALIDETLEVSQ